MLLHITNDFLGSKVYRLLFKKLEALDIKQVVYTAIQKTLRVENSFNQDSYGYRLEIAPILSLYTRINFYEKKRRILRDIESKTNFSQITCIHAHTWYSDGAIAYELYKKYHIPYVITIRNTDINLFFPKMLHLRRLGFEILENAEKIIFISASHQKRLMNDKRIKHIYGIISNKCYIIPSGLDQYWLEHLKERSISNGPSKFIYVGNFEQVKNVPRLMKSIIKYNKKHSKSLTLTIVGGRGLDTMRIHNLIKFHKNTFTYVPFTSSRDELLALYRQHDFFVMPSLAETFGLVYIEALSQGLPIMYSKGEGVDGYIPDKFGVAVNPRKTKSIVNGLEELIEKNKQFHIDMTFISQNFNWSEIAMKYKRQIYSQHL